MKRDMTAQEIEDRTAHYADLQPMTVPIDRSIVPEAAMDVIFARKIMPIIMEQTKNPFGDVSAIFDANTLERVQSAGSSGVIKEFHFHDQEIALRHNHAVVKQYIEDFEQHSAAE
ncbi:MAG TPA: hypothetical protein EYQ81_10340 [Sneathiellales bacterium]|nr:hypothetical protein [Sneathiellales bacterium]